MDMIDVSSIGPALLPVHQVSDSSAPVAMFASPGLWTIGRSSAVVPSDASRAQVVVRHLASRAWTDQLL